MSKKSLFYVAGGALLILMAVLTFFESALSFSSTMRPYFEKAELSFKIFKSRGFFKYFMREGMGFQSWARIILLALAGIVCLVKAFMPDLIPSIALGGIFGLLAVLALIGFSIRLINMFRLNIGFTGFLCYAVWLLMDLLTLAAYGGMAAIIILKDSLGGLFFVPAAAAVVNAFIAFLVNVTGMFKMFGMSYQFMYLNNFPSAITWTFGASLLFLIIDCVLVAALFAVGMANNEE